jgi:hypothetical protein
MLMYFCRLNTDDINTNQTSQLYSKTGQIKISQSLHDMLTGNVLKVGKKAFKGK